MPPTKRQRRAPAGAPAAPTSTTAFAISTRAEAVALETGYEEYPLAHSMATSVTHMGRLPNELLEHVAWFAFNNGDGVSVASTSRSLRDATLRAAGAASIFELVVLIALRRIAGDDIAARMQLVHRALAAGHRAQLFTWPPTESHPLPSPLREHICPRTGVTAHTLPLEHNLTVHISDPVDQDAAPFLDIESINLYSNFGHYWRPGDAVKTVHLDCHGRWNQTPFLWHPKWLGQLVLVGQTETVSNIVSYNATGRQCCRRMAIVLRPQPL